MSHLARSIRRCLALATVTTTSLCAGTAFAATNELEEIVVTAQKQEQKLSETPLSVTALSSTDLTALAATQFRDFANTVPGLGFTSEGVGSTQINLRGITSGRKCLADRWYLRGRGPVRIEHGVRGRRDSRWTWACSTSTASRCCVDRRARCTAPAPWVAR